MSVTTPVGFAATGIAAGIKGGDRPGLAVVSNLGPRLAVAGVFTRNRVSAAPVDWSRWAAADGRLCTVVLNSGGANAYADRPEFADTRAMAKEIAAGLGVAVGDVAVCSIGLIGVRLPMPEVTSGIEQTCAQLSLDGGGDAATTIMTTDTVSKQAVYHGEGWSIGGMAKRAGMLAPGLATVLVILITDADLEAPVLDTTLREASRVSFERADADGCMSTNDTVLLLTSGASDITPETQEFTAALNELCQDLARQLIVDVEGAGYEIAIEVVGAASVRDAETMGREVARSNLFRCAALGCDSNWGRALSTIGVTDAVFEADRLSVSFNGVQVCRGGSTGEPRELVDLSGRKVHALIDLHAGEAVATILTTDPTYEYVKENTEYS